MSKRWATVSSLDRISNCHASAALPQTRDVSAHSTKGHSAHADLEKAFVALAENGTIDVDGRGVLVEDLRIPAGAEPEIAFSHDVISGETKRLGRLDGHRGYPDTPYSTICGTADGVGQIDVEIDGKVVTAAWVTDWKTGHPNFLPESDSWQMRALSFMAARSMGLEWAISRITGVREGFVTQKPQKLWTPEELKETEILLRKMYDSVNHVARRGVEIGDVVHGYHCSFCPAFAACPYMAKLLSGGRLTQVDTRDMAQAYHNLQALKTATKRLEDGVKYAAEAAPIPLGNNTFFGKTKSGFRKYINRGED